MSACEQISATVSGALGLEPRAAWQTDLVRAVSEVSRELGCAPQELPERVASDRRILGRVASYLTVSETFFLRHPSQLEFVCDRLVERLHSEPQARPSLWSAGCSSGEEPYSLAALLDARLSPGDALRVSIQATDASAAALDKARRAVYTIWSFRSAPAWLMARYFTAVAPGAFQLAMHLRERVAFDEEDLEARVKTLLDGALDAIFFRNVAIYLQRDRIESLFNEMARVLRVGGFLVLSPSDPRPTTGPWRRRDDEESTAVYERLAATPVATRDVASDPKALRTRPPRHQRRAPKAATPGPAPRQRLERRPVAAPPNVVPLPSRSLAAALELADRGNLDSALEAVARLCAVQPDDSENLLARGRMLLAAGKAEQAVGDFRRVVYLQPTHATARFWLASGWTACGETRRALREVDSLLLMLGRLPGDALLEDGQTRVGDLLAAVRTLAEGLR